MTHPLAYFQKLYVIDFPGRTGRGREIGKQLAGLGLDRSHPLVQFFPAVLPEDRGPFAGLRARGRFETHLEVLRSARARKLKRVLILEDDLDFAPDFPRRISALAEVLGACDWSFFYGAYALEKAPEAAGPSGIQTLAPPVPVRDAPFMAINGPDTIAACADHLGALLAHPPGGPLSVDTAYSRFRKEHPGGSTLVAVPALGRRRDAGPRPDGLGWLERLPLAREATAWLRQWRNA